MKSHNLGILAHNEGEFRELENLTSIDYSFSLLKEEVPIYGANVYCQDITKLESASLELSWYLYNFRNEERIGLNTSYGAGIFEKNIIGENSSDFYLCFSPDGEDLVGLDNFSATLFTSGLLSSYSVTAAVGDFPKTSVSIDALDIKHVDVGFDSYFRPGGIFTFFRPDGTSIYVTAGTIDLPPFVGSIPNQLFVRPGDIRMDLGDAATALFRLPESCVQSFSLEITPERDRISYLSERVPSNRKIRFPIPFTVTLEINPSEVNDTSLEDLLCQRTTQYMNVVFGKTPCAGGVWEILCGYSMRNIKLVSQDFSMPLNEDGNMTFKWEGQIGGFNDQHNGVFLFKADTYEGVFSTEDETLFDSEEGDYFSP